MSDQPGVDAEFYVAVLRSELARVNDERLMLRALLDQAMAKLERAQTVNEQLAARLADEPAEPADP